MIGKSADDSATKQEDYKLKKGKKRKKDKEEVFSFAHHRKKLKMFFYHIILSIIAVYSTVYHYLNACIHCIKDKLLHSQTHPAHVSHDATLQRSKMKKSGRDDVHIKNYLKTISFLLNKKGNYGNYRDTYNMSQSIPVNR